MNKQIVLWNTETLKIEYFESDDYEGGTHRHASIVVPSIAQYHISSGLLACEMEIRLVTTVNFDELDSLITFLNNYTLHYHLEVEGTYLSLNWVGIHTIQVQITGLMEFNDFSVDYTLVQSHIPSEGINE